MPAPFFIVRPARVEDADAIARAHHQSWEETYPGLMPPALLQRMSFEHRLAQWRRIIHETPEGGARFVAELTADAPRGLAAAAASPIVGVAQCGPAREPELQARHEIWMLYVLRDAQGFGVGTALLGAMFDFLAGRDGANPDRSVGLWVLKGNDRAIRFYEKRGATRTGTIKRDERRGVAIEDVGMRWASA